jgi:hypothetical protein
MLGFGRRRLLCEKLIMNRKFKGIMVNNSNIINKMKNSLPYQIKM